MSPRSGSRASETAPPASGTVPKGKSGLRRRGPGLGVKVWHWLAAGMASEGLMVIESASVAGR